MHKIALLVMVGVLLLSAAACDSALADSPKTITLSDSEKSQATSIATHRQDIAFERQKVVNTYQAQMNRLAETENELNLQSTKLCFSLKKAHAIDPTKAYVLDEWRGELRKQ